MERNKYTIKCQDWSYVRTCICLQQSINQNSTESGCYLLLFATCVQYIIME